MNLELEGSDASELANDVITISQLQIALRAEARRLQGVLNTAEYSDTSTSEGLFELLQQGARALLDYSRYWTHVASSSQTVNSVEEAEALYNQLLITEQRKFSAETLTDVNGVVTRRNMNSPSSGEKPAYIVVTLLLGTADDRPLFDEIYSASYLRDILDDIRMMQSRYLLVFQILWSPQDEQDSLTEEELAAEYGNLVEIA